MQIQQFAHRINDLQMIFYDKCACKYKLFLQIANDIFTNSHIFVQIIAHVFKNSTYKLQVSLRIGEYICKNPLKKRDVCLKMM